MQNLFRVNFLVISIVIFCSCSKNHGNNIREGMITYSIDYPELKDQFFIYQVLPKQLTASFKDNKMEMKIQKTNLENTILIDSDKKKMSAFFSYGNSYVTTLDKKDIKKLISTQEKYKIDFTKEKDTMIGLSVKKAIATKYGNPDEKIELWYTDQISFKNPNWFNPFHKVPGTLLSYSITKYGIKMEFKATKFQEISVHDSILTFNRVGEKINYLEFDKKMIDLFESLK
jgi:hypothetical protein